MSDIRQFNFVVQAPATPTVLQLAAQSLAAGQSVKVNTTLPLSTLVFGGETATFIMWGSSAYYDPTRKEIGFIGKRNSSYPYHWLVYDETSNTWSNTREPWSTASVFGHGYDHNAIDAATGTVYHRPYNTNTVRAWNGSWSALPAWSFSMSIAGGLTWFPGVGLCYNDSQGLIVYSGGAWTRAQNPVGAGYHEFSEHNASANVLIFGGGNESAYYKMTAGLVVSSIATPPFKIGSAQENTPGQGVCVSDPSSGNYVAYERSGSYRWAEYNVATNTWSLLTQSTGDGSSPQSGTPNIAANLSAVIACTLPQYGVMAFIKDRGALGGELWLYRHT